MKKTITKRLIFCVLAVFMVFSIVGCFGDDDSYEGTLQLTNYTGETIWYVYIVPTGNDWGSDYLGSVLFYDGETYSFSVDLDSETEIYDFRVENAYGDYAQLSYFTMQDGQTAAYNIYNLY